MCLSPRPGVVVARSRPVLSRTIQEVGHQGQLRAKPNMSLLTELGYFSMVHNPLLGNLCGRYNETGWVFTLKSYQNIVMWVSVLHRLRLSLDCYVHTYVRNYSVHDSEL